MDPLLMGKIVTAHKSADSTMSNAEADTPVISEFDLVPVFTNRSAYLTGLKYLL